MVWDMLLYTNPGDGPWGQGRTRIMKYSEKMVDEAIAQARCELAKDTHDTGSFWYHVLSILQTQAGK